MCGSRGVSTVFLLAVLAGAAGSLPAQQRPAADTAWRFHAGTDIEWLRECSSAELLVTTKSVLTALDAVTGARLWEHTNLPSVGSGLYWRCGGTTGLSYRKDQIVAFDLVSGERRWNTSALPAHQEIRGYVAWSGQDVLLLFLRTAASDRALVAMRLSTGERLWQRDDVFQYPPTFASRGGVSDISEFQSFLTDTDTTLILYATADGPIRMDLRTGATLWKGDALAGPRVPSLSDYAEMLVSDSILIVPRDKGLVALDTRDGRLLWSAPALLPKRATRLVRVPSGVLVRAGQSYVAVLDPATGTLRWSRPLTVPTDGGAYRIVGNRYFVVSKDRLLAVDLETGDTTGLASLAFRDGEHAELLLTAGTGLVVVSRQNLFRAEPDGTIRFHRYYRAPGASFFQVLGGMSPAARFGAATFREEYAYFVTSTPDTTGRTGNSLARVSLDDGREAGRIWFKEKSPRYWPDTGRDQLLILTDNRTLVAVRFPTAATVTAH